MIKYIPIINRFVVNECQLGDKIKSLKSHNIIPILDYAVETNLHSMNNILYPRYNTNDSFKENYKKILDSHSNNFHALKLSGFPNKFDVQILYKDISYIINKAKTQNCNILIDAENNDTYNNHYDLVDKLCLSHT